MIEFTPFRTVRTQHTPFLPLTRKQGRHEAEVTVRAATLAFSPPQGAYRWRKKKTSWGRPQLGTVVHVSVRGRASCHSRIATVTGQYYESPNFRATTDSRKERHRPWLKQVAVTYWDTTHELRAEYQLEVAVFTSYVQKTWKEWDEFRAFNNLSIASAFVRTNRYNEWSSEWGLRPFTRRSGHADKRDKTCHAKSVGSQNLLSYNFDQQR